MVAATPDQPVARTFFHALVDGQRLDAVELLESLGDADADADALAMRLATLLHDQQPTFHRRFSLLHTLNVVIALIRGHHIDRTIPYTDHAQVDAEAQRLRHALKGVYDSRQQAMSAAVLRVGGAATFGITSRLEDALADSFRPVDADTLDAVEFLARTSHGWHLIAAPVTRFVLYRENDTRTIVLKGSP